MSVALQFTIYNLHISIIDDERILTSKISKKLKLNGYTVSEYYSFNEFINTWYNGDITDLYIVDLSLGDGSGFDIISFLREEKKITKPIIIISGFGDTSKIIFGLNIGGDDYLTKPFHPDELLARIKALLRRPNEIRFFDQVKYKDLSIDLNTKDVRLSGELLDLVRKEKLIIELFLTNIGKLVKKDDFIKYVWGTQTSIDVNDNTINATLSKLRRRLGENFPLQTKHNIGYILN